MLRRLFALLVSLSLALLVISCVLWVRSYRHFEDEWNFRTPGTHYWVGSYQGSLDMARNGVVNGFVGNPVKRSMDTFAFDVTDIEYRNGSDVELEIPYWVLATMTLIPPLIWMARWRRRTRRAAGKVCENCGYDLRATPERCPECGTASKTEIST
jgi:hypothetical protein